MRVAVGANELLQGTYQKLLRVHSSSVTILNSEMVRIKTGWTIWVMMGWFFEGLEVVRIGTVIWYKGLLDDTRLVSRVHAGCTVDSLGVAALIGLPPGALGRRRVFVLAEGLVRMVVGTLDPRTIFAKRRDGSPVSCWKQSAGCWVVASILLLKRIFVVESESSSVQGLKGLT